MVFILSRFTTQVLYSKKTFLIFPTRYCSSSSTYHLFRLFYFPKKMFRLLCSELLFFSDSVWSSLHKTNIAFLLSINFSGQNVKIFQCCFSYLYFSCVPRVLIFETFDTREYKWDKLSCLLTAPDSVIYIRYAYDTLQPIYTTWGLLRDMSVISLPPYYPIT